MVLKFNLYKHAIGGVKWTAISKTITSAFQILQIAILARLLQPEDFGLMTMVMVIIGFARSFMDMGISNAIIHRQKVSKEQLSSLYLINIAAGFIIFLIIITTTHLVVIIYDEPRLTNLIKWASVIILIMVPGQQFQTLMEKKLLFRRLAFVEITSASIGFATAVSTALFGQGVYAIIWGQLSNSFIMTILLMIVGWQNFRPRILFNWSELNGFISFGMFQMGERAMNFLSSNLDKLFIGVFLGAQAVGFYTVAYQLMIKPFQMINPIVTKVAFPLFAKIQDDDLRLRRGYLDVIRIISFVLFPVYMGMIILAKPFILIVLGADWLPSVNVFQLLAILGFFFTLGNPLGSILLAKGRADMGFYLNLFKVFICGVAIWYASRFGIEGIATGLIGVMVLVLVPLEFWVRFNLIKMKPKEYFASFMPALEAAIVMGGMIYLINRYVAFTINDIFTMILFFFVGIVIYLAVVYLRHKHILLYYRDLYISQRKTFRRT